MLNNFGRDSNNLFGKENRLIYLNDFESPFAGEKNEQLNYTENGEITDGLRQALDNIDSLSDASVEPGNNLYRTLVNLFGNDHLAAELTDALDDSEAFAQAFDEIDAMYSPENICDQVAYVAETKELQFLKDGEVLFSQAIDTLHSNLFLRLDLEHEGETLDAQADGVDARAEVMSEVTTGTGSQEAAEALANMHETSEAIRNQQAMQIQLTEINNNFNEYVNFALPNNFRDIVGRNTRRGTRNQFREMVGTGRIENIDLIQDYCRTLGMNLDNLIDIVIDGNYGREIEANLLLRRTPYATRNRRGRVERNQNGSFRGFIDSTTALFTRRESLNPQEMQQLQSRNDTLTAIYELINSLKTLQESPAEVVDPDYVTDVEMSANLKDALDIRGGEFRGGKDEFGVFAIYTYIYGPIEDLIEDNAGITVTTDENGEQTISISSILPDHLDTLQRALNEFPDMERLNIGIRNRRTLTRALESLRSDSAFSEFRNLNYRYNLDRSLDNTERVEHHLAAIFDNLDFGPTHRQHRRTLQAWEAEFNSSRSENQDYQDTQFSSATMYSWILNDPSILIRENGETHYDLNAVANRLKELAEAGKMVLFLDRDLVDDPERVRRLQQTNTEMTPEWLLNYGGLNQELIQLIRYGALHEGMVQRSLTEFMDAAPPRTPLYDNFVTQMLQNGVPPQDIPELIVKAEDFLARVMQNENGEVDGLDLGVSRTFAMDRNGDFTIAPNAGIDTDGDFALGIRLTGNMVNTDRTQVYTGFHFGMRQETMNPVENAPSVSVTVLGISQELGHRDWNMTINVGGTAGLRFRPVFFQAGIEFNQGTRALLRREYRRDETMGDVEFATIERMRDGERLTDAEVIQFLEDLGNDHPLNQALENSGEDRTRHARTYVEMLAEAEMMDTIRDARGVTFGFGGGFPAVLFIKFNFLGRERTFYRIDSVRDTQTRVSEDIYATQLAQEEIQRNPSASFTITTTSGEISYDGQSGRLETTMGTSVTERTNFSAETSMVEVLNAGDETHGIFFEAPEQGSPYDATFSLYGLDRAAGVNTSTEILIDPVAQVTVTAIGPNEFGLNFNGTPNGEIPRGFGVTRQEITYPYGTNNTREVSITFSTRPTSAERLRGNRFADRIRVNEQGIVTSTDHVLSQLEGLEAPSYYEGAQEPMRFFFETEQDRTEAIAASQALAEAVGTERINETYEPSAEILELVARIENDDALKQQLAEDTTISIQDQSPANYQQVVQKINEVAGFALTDADIQYVLGRTIPGTFLTLTDSRFDGRRVEEVTRVTEEIFRSHVTAILENSAYNQHFVNGELVEFTAEEKTQIIDSITSISLEKIQSIADNIENMATTDAYELLPGFEFFTTAALRQMGEAAKGLREFLIGPGSNIDIVRDSITYITDPLASEFIFNLYNPVLPEVNEGISKEQINTILQSETALNLVSSNENGISILARLYGAEGVRLITELYNQLNTNDTVSWSLNEMDGFNHDVVEHFLSTVAQLRNNFNSEPQAISFNGSQEIMMGLTVETGSVLIQPCGNLTLFAHQSLTTEFEEQLYSEGVNVAFGRGLILSEAENQRVSRSATVGIPTPRLRRPDTPPEEPDDQPEPEDEPPKDPDNAGNSNSNRNPETGEQDRGGYEGNVSNQLF